MRLAISFPHGMVLQFPPRGGGGGWAAPTRRQPGVARPPACFAAFGRKTPPPPPPPQAPTNNSRPKRAAASLSRNPWGLGGRNAVRKSRAASARGAFLALPCSLGFRLAPPATGGARLCPHGGFDRIWRHKVNCPEGTREGPLGGARQIRKKPCVARVSLHNSLAAP